MAKSDQTETTGSLGAMNPEASVSSFLGVVDFGHGLGTPNCSKSPL